MIVVIEVGLYPWRSAQLWDCIQCGSFTFLLCQHERIVRLQSLDCGWRLWYGPLRPSFFSFVTEELRNPSQRFQVRVGKVQNISFLGSVHQTMLLSFVKYQTAMYQVISYSQVGMCMCVSKRLADSLPISEHTIVVLVSPQH